MLKLLSTFIYAYTISTATFAAPPQAGTVPTDSFPGPFFDTTETTPEVKAKPVVTLEQMLDRIKTAKNTTVRINSEGDIEANDAENWDCVHRKTSDLTWEVKTKSGLRDSKNTYTWLKPLSNDEFSLVSWFKYSSGKCVGDSRCDTSSYVKTINQQRLCGFSDWRLPTRVELESLIEMNRGQYEAKIDSSYFPNTLASWYWTDDANEDYADHAWYVLFRNGTTVSDKKESPKHIRLVRGSL